MSSAVPKPPILRSGQYDEPATFGDIQALHKFMVENHVRPSLSSPPLAYQLGELTFVFDKTLLRLYTKIDGTLRYVQFT
jgi:hypothetical protein